MIGAESPLALESMAQILELRDDVVASVGAPSEAVKVAGEIDADDHRPPFREPPRSIVERGHPALKIGEHEDETNTTRSRHENLDPTESSLVPDNGPRLAGG
jgi:hypothetical protein